MEPYMYGKLAAGHNGGEQSSSRSASFRENRSPASSLAPAASAAFLCSPDFRCRIFSRVDANDLGMLMHSLKKSS
jgi:hypothetical protein